jgi:hypothetical protein
MGLTLPQLSNFENGVPLSKNAAIGMAKRIPGLTTDWLFMGREEGLSVQLRQRLREAAEQSEGNSSPEEGENAGSQA